MECKEEIEVFLFWKEYIEICTKLEDLYHKEIEYYRNEALKANSDILNNAYVRSFSDEVILEKMKFLSR